MTAAPQAVLGIETSSRCVGVAVLRDAQIISSVERMTAAPRADDLREMVEAVLVDARATLETLSGIAVSIGPGSFTGLRIGASFVKGLATGCPVPVVGVSSTEVIASNIWHAEGPVTVLIDARQQQVHAATFACARGRCRRLTRDRLMPTSALRAWLKRGTLITGDGAALAQRIRGRSLVIAPQEWWWPHAATVARLGGRQLRRGRRMDPATLTPTYLYPRYCSIAQPPPR